MASKTHNYLMANFDRKTQDRSLRWISKQFKTAEILKQDFDGFAVMGISGAIMGALIARKMNKKLVVVRKENDGSHSDYKVENIEAGDKLIFLDDLVASGKTYKRVRDGVNFHGGKILSIILYYSERVKNCEYYD